MHQHVNNLPAVWERTWSMQVPCNLYCVCLWCEVKVWFSFWHVFGMSHNEMYMLNIGGEGLEHHYYVVGMPQKLLQNYFLLNKRPLESYSMCTVICLVSSAQVNQILKFLNLHTCRSQYSQSTISLAFKIPKKEKPLSRKFVAHLLTSFKHRLFSRPRPFIWHPDSASWLHRLIFFHAAGECELTIQEDLLYWMCAN